MSEIRLRNIQDQGTQVPDNIPPAHFNVRNNFAVLKQYGWRIERPVPALAEGYTRVSTVWVQDPGASDYAVPIVTDRLTSEIVAEQEAATLAANIGRWAYENAFLMMCDTLASRTTHERLTFEQIAAVMVQLRGQDAVLYEKLRDAMDMINSALIRYDLHWWDSCVWHPESVVVDAANQLVAMAV